jgi:hypothetical protein
MDVSIGGGTGDHLMVKSSKNENFDNYDTSYKEYDHCTGEVKRRLTWLAMNNDIKTIVVEGNYRWRYILKMTPDK